MIELKNIKKVMVSYRKLLEKYEERVVDFSSSDYKKMIGEVKMFWYRNREKVTYFLSHISEDDNVSFLAGAVRLDIANNGHYEYILVGRTRIINDPFMKMASFYNGNENQVDFEYTNQYVKECFEDSLLLLRQYNEDFYVLPLGYITSSDEQEYHMILSDMAENLFLSMFSKEYSNIEDFYATNKTYEDIENVLLPELRDKITFEELKDVKMPLRDRCSHYLKSQGYIMPVLETLEESYLFHCIVLQFFKQSIEIILIIEKYHMIPFIRNDIVFHYFSLLYQNNLSSESAKKIYLVTYIAYIIQNAFDFSDMQYDFAKKHMGNGKMIDTIIKSVEDDCLPLPEEIVECVQYYMNSMK